MSSQPAGSVVRRIQALLAEQLVPFDPVSQRPIPTGFQANRIRGRLLRGSASRLRCQLARRVFVAGGTLGREKLFPAEMLVAPPHGRYIRRGPVATRTSPNAAHQDALIDRRVRSVAAVNHQGARTYEK